MPNIFLASLIDLVVAGAAGVVWYLNALGGAPKVLCLVFLALFAVNLLVSLIGRLTGEPEMEIEDADAASAARE